MVDADSAGCTGNVTLWGKHGETTARGCWFLRQSVGQVNRPRPGLAPCIICARSARSNSQRILFVSTLTGFYSAHFKLKICLSFILTRCACSRRSDFLFVCHSVCVLFGSETDSFALPFLKRNIYL